MSRTNQYMRFIIANVEELRTIKLYRTRESFYAWLRAGWLVEAAPQSADSLHCRWTDHTPRARAQRR